MTTREAVLQRAGTQLGLSENPFGSNRTPYCDWYGMVGPWCAMFVSWCFFQEGLPLPATTHKGFAYTPSGAAWFKANGRWTSRPARGHVIFFDFIGRISHVGIVESVQPDGTVLCIEGNTDERGGRTGGRVLRRARRSLIVGYGMPPYDDVDEADGILRRGSRGPAVVAWQRELNEATGAHLVVDGLFGTATQR